MSTEAMPPLPEQAATTVGLGRVYTAEQMHAYARTYAADLERRLQEAEDPDYAAIVKRMLAAERRAEDLADAAGKRESWLRRAKREAGYADNTSFDVVWAETLAKSTSAAAGKEKA